MTVYYVGKGGNDANDGLTWTTRKLTLNGAEDIPVAAGDTVYVGAGTYREMLECDVSGAAGSPVTYIGDYSGEHTDGSGGVVRITGSDDDITQTRLRGIFGDGKTHRTFRDLRIDLCSSYPIEARSAENWILDKFYVGENACSSVIYFNGSCLNNTLRNCYLAPQKANYASGIHFRHDAGLSDANNIVENCIIIGNYYGVQFRGVGGGVVRNCTFISDDYGVRISVALPAGQTNNVKNCIFFACPQALSGLSLGEITEDYNTFFSNLTDRTNVAAGAHSKTTPPLFDSRWFFESVK